MQYQIRGVCAIKMVPGADHLGLPDDLSFKPKFMWSTNETAQGHNMYRGRYGRLDMEGLFRTCCTTINPTEKPGTVVHPTQKRVITIREYARAMSFPDHFVFDFDFCRFKDVIRQIGNGVPCNLAKAVGEELFEVLIEKFWREERDVEELEANEEVVEIVLRGSKTWNKKVIKISDDDGSDAEAEAEAEADEGFRDIDDF